ncbi:MAG: YggT family protein [Treponema sp.]|nr:YggT family protein [Treponema sp.]
MRFIFGILASAAGIYSLLILIRIIISWFGNFAYSKPVDLLSRVTDPYLDWWRRHFSIRIGLLDFSVILGIVFLSLIQNIFFSLYSFERITLGNILAYVLLAVWSAVSFILGFFIVILLLRLIAYLTNRDIYSPFWHVIDSISQPVLYRLNRIIFGRRIGSYLKGIIISSFMLAAIWIGGNIVVPKLSRLLAGLPL